MADEVIESHIRDGPRAAVALNHHHLVALPGVDVAVGDVFDIGAGAERAKGTPAGPVAVNVLDEDSTCWTLDEVSTSS